MSIINNIDSSVHIVIHNQDDCKEITQCMNNNIEINRIVITPDANNVILPDIKARSLDIRYSTGIVLPEFINCLSMYISNSDIKEIYSTHKVKSLLNASNMINDLVLPDDYTVNEMFMSYSNISKLPNNLNVLYLDIIGTSIKHIPDGTYIGHKIYCNKNILNEYYPNSTCVKLAAHETEKGISVFIGGYMYKNNNFYDIIKI